MNFEFTFIALCLCKHIALSVVIYFSWYNQLFVVMQMLCYNGMTCSIFKPCMTLVLIDSLLKLKIKAQLILIVFNRIVNAISSLIIILNFITFLNSTTCSNFFYMILYTCLTLQRVSIEVEIHWTQQHVYTNKQTQVYSWILTQFIISKLFSCIN